MNTKEKILDTMYHMIAKYGYDKTSIGMICDEIGIKKPSVYYYFKNKEEILLDIIEQLNNYDCDYDVKKEFKMETFKQDLIESGWRLIDEFENDEEFTKVITEIYNQSGRIQSVKHALDSYDKITLDYFNDVLTYAVEIGSVPKDIDIELNTQILASIMDFLSMQFIFSTKMRDKEIWETTVNRMFLEFDQ